MANVVLVSLEPTRQLGYFCGLVLGDGTIYIKNGRHTITVKSSKMRILREFEAYAVKFGLKPYWYSSVETRRFPNGEVRTDRMWTVRVSSKILCEALAPYKLKDYRFKIPHFLNNSQSLWGFIEGFFDAEGNVHYDGRLRNFVGAVCMGSKHKENLKQIQEALSKFGIESIVYGKVGDYRLQIHKRASLQKFFSNATLSFKIKEAREFVATHREEIAQQRRQYRERSLAYQRALTRTRAWKMFNKDQTREYNRKYRREHQDKFKDYRRRYQLKHKKILCEVKAGS